METKKEPPIENWWVTITDGDIPEDTVGGKRAYTESEMVGILSCGKTQSAKRLLLEGRHNGSLQLEGIITLDAHLNQSRLRKILADVPGLDDIKPSAVSIKWTKTDSRTPRMQKDYDQKGIVAILECKTIKDTQAFITNLNTRELKECLPLAEEAVIQKKLKAQHLISAIRALYKKHENDRYEGNQKIDEIIKWMTINKSPERFTGLMYPPLARIMANPKESWLPYILSQHSGFIRKMLQNGDYIQWQDCAPLQAPETPWLADPHIPLKDIFRIKNGTTKHPVPYSEPNPASGNWEKSDRNHDGHRIALTTFERTENPNPMSSERLEKYLLFDLLRNQENLIIDRVFQAQGDPRKKEDLNMFDTATWAKLSNTRTVFDLANKVLSDAEHPLHHHAKTWVSGKI